MREPEPLAERGREAEIERFLWQENRVWLTVKCWSPQGRPFKIEGGRKSVIFMTVNVYRVLLKLALVFVQTFQ